jgi:hypothetical protein
MARNRLILWIFIDDHRPRLFNTPLADGQVAQLVEQRTENPRVGGSIPSLPSQRVSCQPLINPLSLQTGQCQ